MNRVLFRAMQQREGRYWYRDMPFCGVGFAIASDGQVSAFEVEDGIIARPYHPICAPDATEFLQVDLASLEGHLSDYETPKYLGKPFSGIGYEFTRDVCNFEAFLDRGNPLSEAHWSLDGMMVYFAAPPNDLFAGTYEWYPDGSVKSVDVSTSSSFSGSLRFSEDRRLMVLASRRGFLYHMNDIRAKARMPIGCVPDLATLRWADEVTLAGEDINDDFVDFLLSSGALRGTSKLTLSDTNVKSLDIGGAARLKELNLRDANDIKYLSKPHDTETIHLAQSVKRAKPDIRVVLNGREVK